MNIDSVKGNWKLQQVLASEYVLGTLRGGARHRFERWLRQDPQLRQQVKNWEQRIVPLSELIPASRPQPQLWRHLGKPLSAASTIRVWKSVSAVLTVVALVLGVLLWQRAAAPGTPAYTAVLSASNAQAHLIVTADQSAKFLSVRVLPGSLVSDDKNLVLWLIPTSGKVRPMGWIRREGDSSLPYPEALKNQDGVTLMATLESRTASENRDAPSGTILYKGQWLKTQNR